MLRSMYRTTFQLTKRLAILLVAVSVCRASAAGDPSRLTVDRIYNSKEFKSQSFSGRWLRDSSGYTTLESSKSVEGGRDIVLHAIEKEETSILVPADDLVPPGESQSISIDNYIWAQDMSKLLLYTNSKRVWRAKSRGDYWVLDRSSHELKKLGGSAPEATLQFAKFSPDASLVAYVRERNIYVEDLQSGEIVQLTQTPSDDIINGTFDWVYEEELQLRDGFRWSPDGKSIAYWQLDTSGVREVTLIDNINGLYPRPIPIRYPKVGERNSACRVGVVSIATPQTSWLPIPGDPREHYIARMEWNADTGQLAIQQLNRAQNTNRLFLVDPATSDIRVRLTEQDKAWVDVHDEMKWLSEGKEFTWISERDGWRHIYLGATADSDKLTLITSGAFDAIQLLHVDEDKGSCYFIASPENPAQRYLYRSQLDGSELIRLTPEEFSGSNSYNISPDGEWAFHTWSNASTPPKTSLIQLEDHALVRTLIDNHELVANVKKLKLKPVEFFQVDIGEGVELNAWCISPSKIDEKRKHPLLIYVYGEPAGQTVRDRWGGSGYLWHQMLAQHGFFVMSFDNRGTRAPLGRDWRKFIYRKIGILAPQDQAAAVRSVLKERPYLDPERVGAWGWSGGGSMTLNALFKFPDLYSTGVAIASVPNQRYYDTIYQERYMGLPKDNVDGFLNGSPINFADQLQGNLLLIHGTGDDNCHYQGFEALADKLIAHNKQFTMFAYPNRTHAVRERKNTTRHLRQLMTDYLLRHLESK